MTIVVTGAAGHLGGNLVRALIARGESVRAVDLPRARWQTLDGLEVERVHGDVCDLSALQQAFTDARIVYHTAGFISLLSTDPRTHEVNVNGVHNVLAACRSAGVSRLVHFSSVHALVQEPFDAPLDENRPLVTSPAASPYDRSKAAGQQAVRDAVAHGLDAVILNPTGIFGPHDYAPSLFGSVLVAMACGRVPMLIDYAFDWVDVRDVAAAALRAADVAMAGAEYLLAGHRVSLPEIAGYMQELLGRRMPRWTCPASIVEFAAPISEWVSVTLHLRPVFTRVTMNELRGGNPVVSRARAARELGYAPRPFHETLTDTLRWFADHGFLAGQTVRVTAHTPAA